MFSNFFITRPIFATVLAILMILAGILTVKTLPVAQYPDITPPTVFVMATYPGADAQTVAEAVGVPIEQQVNGVENMMYMSSTSGSDGSYQLEITFENGTDLDMAAVKVQNRVAQAEPVLPTSVKQQGVNVMSRSSDIILFVALESEVPGRYDGLYLTNYAQLSIVDELSRLDGVGQVNAFGSGNYSMRVWLDPEKMRVRGITPEDVTAAISSQNIEVSAGSVGAPPSATAQQFEYTLTSRGRLDDADEFGNIVIRTGSDGAILRLRDIAKIDLGSSSYSMTSNVSGEDAGLIGIYQLPGANAMKVAANVEKKLEELKQYFPEGVDYRIILNTTDFVSASIDEVLVTFLETTLIVMLVILLFLQNWRAVIIPMITIPVSLIATFAVMKLMGFTLNTLTLFGLVLAIAIVVDDAIVVVEDVSRILDKGGVTPTQAAEQAMKELQGPVIGEVLVLLSVFIPTAFISGITGQLYKQFALTIAVSTAFSGFNALTFTPAMCALFLKPSNGQPKFFIYRWFNAGFEKVRTAYNSTVGKLLGRPVMAMVIFAALCVLAFWGFMRWPKSYVPAEDMGYFMTSIQLPTGASLERTDSVVRSLSADIRRLPQVKDIISVAGQSFLGGGASSNLASMFVVLEPWKDRKGKDNGVDAVIAAVDRLAAKHQEAIVFSVNPPSIPGLGMSSGLEMQLLDINNLGAKEIAQTVAEIQKAAADYPELRQISSLYQGQVPQYQLKVDRDKVKLYGLTLEGVYSTLSTFMGSDYVNDFVKFGRTYQVLVSGSADARSKVEGVYQSLILAQPLCQKFARRYGAVCHFRVSRRSDGTADGKPLQYVHDCSCHRLAQPEYQLVGRHQGHGRNHGKDRGPELRICVDGRSITGNPVWHDNHDDTYLRRNHNHPGTCRAIRVVDRPRGRSRHHAHGYTRRSLGLYIPQPKREHLYPNRHNTAPWHGCEKRHPHRRIRHGLPQGRPANTAGSLRCRQRASAPYIDDSHGICIRRDADALRHRCRKPAVVRHGSSLRHGSKCNPRHFVRTIVLGTATEAARKISFENIQLTSIDQRGRITNRCALVSL